MAFRVHISRAAQILDPGSVRDQKAVSGAHIRERVTLSGVRATRQGDVLFDLHGYIVQQSHSQRNHRGPSLTFSVFYIPFFQLHLRIQAQKKVARAFYVNYTITLAQNTVIVHNLLISLTYYTITLCLVLF
jgi:hypothetical protein